MDSQPDLPLRGGLKHGRVLLDGQPQGVPVLGAAEEDGVLAGRVSRSAWSGRPGVTGFPRRREPPPVPVKLKGVACPLPG